MNTRRIARPLGAFAKQWARPSYTRASISQQIQHRAFSRTARRNDENTGAENKREVPELTHAESFSKDGVAGLFSVTGYNLGWITYQEMMLQKLDELLAGEPDEKEDIKNLVLKYARDPQNASVFNHASSAWNNHFFYQGMAPNPQKLSSYKNIENGLIGSFGSIDTLRTTMLDTAASMFGPGYVWLVYLANIPGSEKGGYRILTTYAAGTPFPEAGYRAQGRDANNETPESYAAYQNSVGAFGRSSAAGRRAAKIPPGGTEVVPVLCVSTWEHSYIYDFGLTGKRTYLADWWNAIDWYRVEQRVPEQAKSEAMRASLH